MFTFKHMNRPYRFPLVCMVCRASHLVKTYHVQVDSNGFTIVSPEIWEMMKRHDTSGFQVANEVASPPGQHIDLSTPVPIDLGELNG